MLYVYKLLRADTWDVIGMTLSRASAGDYDSWEQLGNPGWGWDGLFPYFKKSADLVPPSPEVVKQFNYTFDLSAYGSDSPLKGTFPSWQAPDNYAMFDSFNELGIPFLEEHAKGNNHGQAWYPSSIDPKTQTRCSSLTAYYQQVSQRPNLKLLSEHQVTELLFEDNSLTVSGVKATDRKAKKDVTFSAKKEVILAAGTFHTPHILQLSGIGPKSTVEAAGIKSKLDLPAVGSNFQDHPVAYLNWSLQNTFPPQDIVSKNKTFADEALEEYKTNLTGPYTHAQTTSITFMTLSMILDDVEGFLSKVTKQDPAAFLPDIYKNEELLAGFKAQREVLLKQIGEGSVAVFEFPFGGQGYVPNALEKPLSRGTIRLNPKDPHGAPIIT